MRRDGFALLGALWLVVGITSVALELGLWATSRRLAATNLAESTQSRFAAEAGLADLRAALHTALTDSSRLENAVTFLDPWYRANSLIPDVVEVGQAKYSISASDTGARLNLNLAAERELAVFLHAEGVSAAAATSLAAAIADWRDVDDAPRAGGAEAAAYIRAGKPALPANGQFTHVRQLADVMGMDSALFARVASSVTTIGDGIINLNTASFAVLRTLPGVGDAAATAIVHRQRAERLLTSVFELSGDLSGAEQQAFDLATPQLAQRAGVRVRQIEAHITGFVPGSPVRVQLAVLLTRDDSGIDVGWRAFQ
jgi:type II secretory pathway component PulK